MTSAELFLLLFLLLLHQDLTNSTAMCTTIHTLPQELLDLIFKHFAHSSPPHELLQTALVCQSWSTAILPLLYHSVAISTGEQREAFIQCPVKNKYRIHSLSLFDGQNSAGFDPNFAGVEALLQSVDGQPLKTLVLGRSGEFPLTIFSHSSLSSMATLFFLCTGHHGADLFFG